VTAGDRSVPSAYSHQLPVPIDGASANREHPSGLWRLPAKIEIKLQQLYMQQYLPTATLSLL